MESKFEEYQATSYTYPEAMGQHLVVTVRKTDLDAPSFHIFHVQHLTDLGQHTDRKKNSNSRKTEQSPAKPSKAMHGYEIFG